MWGRSRLEIYPLQAAVGFGLDAALAPWRTRAWRNLAAAIALLALTLAVGRVGLNYARGELAASLALRHGEEHHRVTLESLAEGVVTHALDGAVTTWNASALRILGLPAERLKGRDPLHPDWTVVREDGTPWPAGDFPAVHVLRTGDAQLRQIMGVQTGDGQRRWLEVSAVPTRDDGELTGATVSFVDITDQRAALEKIRNLNQELEERVASRTQTLERTSADLEGLVYSMAHTMRSPLRHITSFATLLEEDARGRLSEENLDLLRRIRESSERQARLVDDLLKYTSGHQHPPVRAHVSMDALVDAVVRDTRDRMVDAARVDWVRRPLPRLYGDPAMVSEIMEILISNAVKFSARAGEPRVEIAACEIDGAPGVMVRDNGVGFDMRFADKLFGMFQRLHESEGFRGSGIDLAICKRLVERHGGRIEAEGAVGSGATFRFTLGAAFSRSA
jgi:PAS domain S-box-containing protein